MGKRLLPLLVFCGANWLLQGGFISVALAETSIQPDTLGAGLTYTADSGYGVNVSAAWQPFNNEQWRVRATLDQFFGEKTHRVSLVKFTEDLSRTGIGVNVDRYLFGNSGWYITAGLGLFNQASSWNAHPEPNSAYLLNGRQYAAIHLEEPEVKLKFRNPVPKVGLGWTYKSQTRNSQQRHWQFNAEVELLTGLDPHFSISTTNPYNLPFLEEDLNFEAERYIEQVKRENRFLDNELLQARITFSYNF